MQIETGSLILIITFATKNVNLTNFMIPTELYVKLAPMVAHHAFSKKMTLLSSKQLIMAILLTLTQIPAT